MEIKKQNKILTIALLILLVANVAIISSIWFNKSNPANSQQTQQQPNTKQNYRPNLKNRNAFFQELDLTPQQSIQANNMRQEHFSNMREIRNTINLNKQKIHNELFNPTPDTNYIMELADSIGLLNASLEKLNYEHFLVLKEILEPEQQVKLKQLMDDASCRNDHHKQRWRHRGNHKKPQVQSPNNN